ncbi:MAG: hypothetical protein Q8J67_08445 [Rhodocyclaceae bacterium]|nr:hypothetical protein [Rhodocyclaceae bacterium]MDP2109060.1 hypothetical protein [Rhodocyclaceae bacterium]
MKRLTTGLLACLLLTPSVPALADRGERHFRSDRHERNYDRHPRHNKYFERHHHHGYAPAWGALGLGLAVGGVMLALEAPRPPRVVVVPAAPPVVRSPDRMWYYCESAQTYYPYVQSCFEGWRAVPAY